MELNLSPRYYLLTNCSQSRLSFFSAVLLSLKEYWYFHNYNEHENLIVQVMLLKTFSAFTEFQRPVNFK